MRHIAVFFYVIVCAIILATKPALSEIPSREDVRNIFVKQMEGKNILADTLVRAFVAARDTRFARALPIEPTFSRSLAKRYQPSTVNKGFIIELSRIIETELDPKQIASWYIHTNYFGQNCFGINQAAGKLFEKEVESLEPHEIAYLAILPTAPFQFDIRRSPKRALAARNHTLVEMARFGLITNQELEKELRTKLQVVSTSKPCAGRK